MNVKGGSAIHFTLDIYDILISGERGQHDIENIALHRVLEGLGSGERMF